MVNRRSQKEKQKRMLNTSGICVLALGLGYFLVEVVSEMDKPPLGMIFHVITGCLFIAVGGIVLFMTLKTYFFPKRKKSKNRPVFLNEELTKKKEEESNGIQ